MVYKFELGSKNFNQIKSGSPKSMNSKADPSHRGKSSKKHLEGMRQAWHLSQVWFVTFIILAKTSGATK